MPKRKSMRGMGADAFFSAAAEQSATLTSGLEDGLPPGQLVKATFYLTPEHILQLERIRLARMEKGQKADKSALVREAIDLLQAQG